MTARRVRGRRRGNPCKVCSGTHTRRHEPKIPARHPDDSESRPRPGDPRSRRGVSGSGAAEAADRSHRHRSQQRLPVGRTRCGSDASSPTRRAATTTSSARPRGGCHAATGAPCWPRSFTTTCRSCRPRSARRRTSRSARGSRCSSSTTTSPPGRWSRSRGRPANSRRCTAPRTARRCSPTAISTPCASCSGGRRCRSTRARP